MGRKLSTAALEIAEKFEANKQNAQELASAKIHKAKPVDTWYEVNGQKLVKMQKTVAGSVYSDYVGLLTNPATSAFYTKIKKEGLVRVGG